MNAHYRPTARETKIANEIVDQHYKEIFCAAAPVIARQHMAIVLITLEKTYGWKSKRLHDFIEAVNDMTKVLDKSTFRKSTDAEDAVKYIKNTYGIDLVNELPIEVET